MNNVIWYPGYKVFADNIVKAENCYLYDSRGKKYLDLESGVWCISVGHGHKRLLRIIAEQSVRIMHTGFQYSSNIVEQSAEEILNLFDYQGGKCVFLCSGSEAVEYGVRTAQLINNKPLLMTMSDSYFGAYGSASRKQKAEWFLFDWSVCTGCTFNFNCTSKCEHWVKIPFQKIGGFLFEPGSSSGFVRFPPAGLIKNIADRIRENKGLILINEVTTGIGRTGKWFGYQHYDISPDVVSLGKGIGNGYPVSVVAIAPKVTVQLREQQLHYAQSHQNDPLGAAIAKEVIGIIKDEKLIEKGQNIASVLIKGLNNIKEKTEKITEIRYRGLLVAVVIKDDADAFYTSRLNRKLADQGFLLAQRPGLNILRIDPSLTIEKKDIEKFLYIFQDLLTDTSV